MLCGIITPSSGSGQVAGYDVVRQSESIKQTIGYMSQKFSLYEDLTPVENIRFYLGIYSVPESQWDERIGWAVGQARLEDVKDRLTRELPPGGGSAWRLSVRFFTGRRSFSWMSPPPASIPSRGGTSGNLSGSWPQKGSPSLSRRITWTRP